MAQFGVNVQRLDLYKDFKFRMKWGGCYVVGFNKVSALGYSTELVEHQEDGDLSTSLKSP